MRVCRGHSGTSAGPAAALSGPVWAFLGRRQGVPGDGGAPLHPRMGLPARHVLPCLEGLSPQVQPRAQATAIV